jgi:hypothetical protein
MLDTKKSNTTKELISVYLLITCTKISIRKIFKPLNTKKCPEDSVLPSAVLSPAYSSIAELSIPATAVLLT